MGTQEFAGLRFQAGAAVVSGVVVTAAFGERSLIHRDDVQDIASGKRPHDSITQEAAAQAEAAYKRFYEIAKGLVGRFHVASEHKAVEVYKAELAAAGQQSEPAVAEVAL